MPRLLMEICQGGIFLPWKIPTTCSCLPAPSIGIYVDGVINSHTLTPIQYSSNLVVRTRRTHYGIRHIVIQLKGQLRNMTGTNIISVGRFVLITAKMFLGGVIVALWCRHQPHVHYRLDLCHFLSFYIWASMFCKAECITSESGIILGDTGARLKIRSPIS